MENLFEKATRAKLRFESNRGLLSVEDLWDLPLTSTRGACLNDVAKAVNRQLKASTEEDFVNISSPTDQENTLKLELVKYVIGIKMAENEQARAAADRREKKARLLELIGKKQDQELEGKSLTELQEMVSAL